MGRNLGPLNIKDSYEGLVQISGSQLTDGSGSLIPSLDVTASFATSASHAIFADTAGFATDVNALYTASVVDATISFLKGGGGTFPITVNNVANAVSASYATTALSASYATTALSASFATTASYAESSSADNLTLQQATDNGATTNVNGVSFATATAGGQINVGSLARQYQQNGINSVYAGQGFTIRGGTSASTLTLTGNDNPSINSITLKPVAIDADNIFIQGDTKIADDLYVVGNITASNASFTSASIGYLQTITGSAVIIGDEFVVLNANTPTARYAGLQVYDSGSAATASFEWDGQQDIWIQVDETGLSGVMLTGNKSTKGVELFPTLNTLQKGNGDSTLSNSSITDDGTLVTINANISSSGYVSASTYYGDGSNLSGITTDTGSLLTTASYSDPLLTFTKGDGSTFDVTISSDPFPYTGSAVISGSLSVLTDVVDGYSITSGSLSGSLVDNLGQQSIVSGSAVKHIVNLSQAEYDALTPDANTLYAIDGSEVLGNTIISGSLIGDVQTIPVASNTGSLDCSLGNMFILALVGGQDVRLEASNVQQGQVINIRILNDSTAGTISFDTNVFKFEGGTPFTATATPGVVDILTTTCFEDTSYLFTVGVKDFQI